MLNDINDLGDFSQVRVVYNTDTHNLSNLLCGLESNYEMNLSDS